MYSKWLHELLGAVVQVMSQEPNCSRCFRCHVIYVSLPLHVFTNSDSKILGTINCFQNMTMEGVSCYQLKLLFVHILITWHFSGWKFICHLHSQSCSASRSIWSRLQSIKVQYEQSIDSTRLNQHFYSKDRVDSAHLMHKINSMYSYRVNPFSHGLIVLIYWLSIVSIVSINMIDMGSSEQELIESIDWLSIGAHGSKS